MLYEGFHFDLPAIGDFDLKFRASFKHYLFSFMPTTSNRLDPDPVVKYNITPPYLSATPSVRFIDLQPYWADGPIITIFTDGVDNLVSGDWVFHQEPEEPCKVDPCQAVAALLRGDPDSSLAEILGHPVDPHWNGEDGNRAVEGLVNLLGGTNVERLETCMDQKMVSSPTREPPIYIDDTSIIVCDLAKACSVSSISE